MEMPATARELLRISKSVLPLFLIWRMSLFAFVFVGSNLTYERKGEPYHAFPNNYFVDGWVRWDSLWYGGIAEKGYYVESGMSNAVFFPLYPYLSRYVGKVVGSHHLAGMLISNISLFFALVFISMIGQLFLDEEKVRRSLILLLIFPSSYFLSAYYTEGLFLLTISGSLYFFLKNTYLLSGLLGMLAMLTRPTGIILFGVYATVIGYNLLRKKEKFERSTLYLLLIPSGLLIFMCVLYVQVHDPLAFARYQQGWGRHGAFPLETLFVELGRVDLSFPRDAANMQRLVELTCAIGFLVISLCMIKRFHPALWLLVLFGILLPLFTGVLLSIPRYASVLFPAFFWLSELAENRAVERFLIYAFAFFLSLYNLLFFNWYWTG